MTRDKDSAPVVGWIDSPEFDRHDNGPFHPECRTRLEVIRERLEQSGLGRALQSASPSPIARDLLEQVHSPGYVAEVEALAARGGGALDADTAVGPHTFRTACLAAGGVVDAVERVVEGTWQRAFCSVRPPGHHALRDRGMGFCIFNNVALAAVAALRHPTIERVAIVDWDAHHGNGTQEIFNRDARVLYASWHQSPLFPHSGTLSETGEGLARGTIVNCPMRAGAGDDILMAGWTDVVEPALVRFAPQFVIISAGFDGDQRDPLTDLALTTAGLATLSSAVVAFADRVAGGRVVSALEGGYHVGALAEGVAAHVETLLR